jgi:hypothetical protein
VDGDVRPGRAFFRKLQNEELYNLCTSSTIIRMIKSATMRLSGRVERMGIRKMYIEFWWESQNERGHYKDLDVGGKIMLSLLLVTSRRGFWVDESICWIFTSRKYN